jgi:hypothetical protein
MKETDSTHEVNGQYPGRKRTVPRKEMDSTHEVNDSVSPYPVCEALIIDCDQNRSVYKWASFVF